MDDGQLPKLIAFDLDYTLWDFWIDTHVEPPLKHDALTGIVHDSAIYPTRVEFYKDVPEILCGLKGKPEVTVAVASRTCAAKLAREALRLIKIPASSSVSEGTSDALGTNEVESLPAIHFFDHLEIYPGSKIAHFKQFHKTTGIPYSEMLFFDDESRNQEVEKELGIVNLVFGRGRAHTVALRGDFRLGQGWIERGLLSEWSSGVAEEACR